MTPIPHEFIIAGVYLPPMLIASFLGLIAAIFTGRVFNHYGIVKYFYYPPLVTISLAVIYSILLSTFVIGA